MKRYSYIIFYHRILPENLKIFEWQIKIFSEYNYIVSIDEIENFSEKYNGLIITFDDGFYDNFVYAFPILKKYGVKATIFLITNKIKESGIRKNLIDYWNGKIEFTELNKQDNNEYLTWEEIYFMYKSGIINFHAHSHSHYTHYINNHRVNYSQRRLKYLRENMDKRLNFKVAGLFKGNEYLPNKNRFESELEREERLRKEFLYPKEYIKKYLGYESDHFCWPWGEYDNFSLKLGKKFGYRYFYTTEKGVLGRTIDYCKIPRISSSFKKLTFLKRHFIYPNKLFATIFRLKN